MSDNFVSYFDASALVKLTVVEPESSALRRYTRKIGGKVSSQLARVEILRAVRGHDARKIRQAREVLRRISLISIDESLLAQAAMLDALSLRTLDSIHLATALSLGEELKELVTYDRRLREGAEALGLSVVAPA